MLSLKFIRENADLVIERLSIKQFDAKDIVAEILEGCKKKNRLQSESDSLRSDINNISKSIGLLMKQGKRDEADNARAKTAKMKKAIKALDKEFSLVDTRLEELQLQLPNIPAEQVPTGGTAKDNITISSGGDIPEQCNDMLPHWELAEKYNLIDFEAGVKVTGAGFPVYKGYGARLQRALVNFFLDQARDNGYVEVQPPYVVNEASAFGTGQLPDKDKQMYHITDDNLYLIPTAEVPVTNIYKNSIIEAKELPIKNCAYSACFRREAGSYGKDVRGLNRLHQFDKVEIVQVVHPDESYNVLDEMVTYVQKLIEKLELPYRILRLCGGDTSFTSALTYDFEVWSAAQKRWLEVSSVSNFEEFQSNRMKLRCRNSGEKQPHPVHTLNGSALALPRIVAALLENNQTKEGIKVPEMLIPYMGCSLIN